MFHLFSKPKPAAKRVIKATDPRAIEKFLVGKTPGVPLESILKIAESQPFHFKVTRSRSSKSGDFRAPHNGNAARITVNGDLNQHAFLITLVHELAHHMAVVHRPPQNTARLNLMSTRKPPRPKPHGPEWKTEFRQLMAPFMFPHIIPPEVLFPLTNYLKNPKASSTADEKLLRALRKFDRQSDLIHLEELPFNAVFQIKNGMAFQKKDKLRTRFTCIHLKTKRTYRISPLAEVKPVEDISSLL